MDQEILAKARSYLQRADLHGAFLSNPAVITWLTGYAPPILSGPSPFEAGAGIAWIDSKRVVLLVSDGEQGGAAAAGAEVEVYTGYQIDMPMNPVQLHGEAFTSLLGRLNLPGTARIGHESLPSHVWKRLIARWTSAEYVEIDGWSDSLRAVKTEGEIARIRASCDLCSAAQAVLREAASSGELLGKTEIEIFDLFLVAIESKAGERLPVLADLVAGLRTAGIGGLPTNYRIQQGDPVLADIVPRFNGYWGDICNVHFAGAPSADMRKLYTASREALTAAIDAVKPGVLASNIDRIARDAIARQGYPVYPHHTGHGVGTTWHEEPRICGYNNTPLEAGMVLALEPGVYVEGVGGVRLEHVLLVTPTGAEILTNHSMEI